MRVIGLAVVLAVSLTLGPLAAWAQQIPKIGVISPASSASMININALRDGLHDLGYAEDRNIVIELRFADGRFERVPQFVTELVAHGVGLLVVGGTTPVVLAKKAAPASVPIVFTGVSDPIEVGGHRLVRSARR